MVSTALVEEYKNAGREFLTRLDETEVDVTVTGLEDPLIQELAARVQNRTGLAKIFVRKEFLKSTYVEDAYIYRMNV